MPTPPSGAYRLNTSTPSTWPAGRWGWRRWPGSSRRSWPGCRSVTAPVWGPGEGGGPGKGGGHLGGGGAGQGPGAFHQHHQALHGLVPSGVCAYTPGPFLTRGWYAWRRMAKLSAYTLHADKKLSAYTLYADKANHNIIHK